MQAPVLIFWNHRNQWCSFDHC